MGVLTFSSGFWEAAPLWCVTGIVLGRICFGLQGKEHFLIGQLSAYVRPEFRMFHVNYVPRDQFFAGSQRCEAIGLGSGQNDHAVHADETEDYGIELS